MSDDVSPQKDTFVRDRLPPMDQWPVMAHLPDIPNSGPLNCCERFLDRHLHDGYANRPALFSEDRIWTYGLLADHVGRIANVMRHRYGIAPGNRVLLRIPNSPEAVAAWLAVQRIGAVAVTTMSLLRAAELRTIIEIAQPALCICDEALIAELNLAIETSAPKPAVIACATESGTLFDAMREVSPDCPICPTLADDISIIGFTSGTTGKPKATIHFHRDMIAICETVARHMLSPRKDDIFIGTAPLAFTFGLGGLLAFPLYFGAASVLHGRYAPAEFTDAIARYRGTICFTVPTYYQQMMRAGSQDDLRAKLVSLRLAVSSGEALPLPVREAWSEATGLSLTEVLGSTEMLHAFAGATGEHVRPGYIGPAIPGYAIAVLDEHGRICTAGEIGRFAVRGPTGCRYMDDPRQKNYVQYGWNLTGDACAMSEDGYVAYHTRYDDMIISSGYNISGLEVENVLLEHPDVAECAVIGEPDNDRGQIVAAYVVIKAGATADEDLAAMLQNHVKATIAPYKYPRRVVFLDGLPRNESGKIQRFRLRDTSTAKFAKLPP